MTGAPFFHIHGFARVLDSNPGDRKVSFSFRLNKETKLDLEMIWPSGDKVQLPQAGDLVEVDAAAIGHTATRVSWRIPNYRRAIVLKAPGVLTPVAARFLLTMPFQCSGKDWTSGSPASGRRGSSPRRVSRPRDLPYVANSLS